MIRLVNCLVLGSKDGWLNGAAVLGVPVKATIKEVLINCRQLLRSFIDCPFAFVFVFFFNTLLTQK
jgi:hypothetical protein